MVKFEKVSKVQEDIKLPERATKNSAGYDFFNIEDTVIPSKTIKIIMTGVKCELSDNMVLILANRSSNPKKKHLILINGIGVIDADYYNNPDNEGEIGFAFYNISDEDVVIKKGEKLGQGVITTFIKTDNDSLSNPDKTRVGGFGSTGK